MQFNPGQGTRRLPQGQRDARLTALPPAHRALPHRRAARAAAAHGRGLSLTTTVLLPSVLSHTRLMPPPTAPQPPQPRSVVHTLAVPRWSGHAAPLPSHRGSEAAAAQGALRRLRPGQRARRGLFPARGQARARRFSRALRLAPARGRRAPARCRAGAWPLLWWLRPGPAAEMSGTLAKIAEIEAEVAVSPVGLAAGLGGGRGAAP